MAEGSAAEDDLCGSRWVSAAAWRMRETEGAERCEPTVGAEGAGRCNGHWIAYLRGLPRGNNCISQYAQTLVCVPTASNFIPCDDLSCIS